MSASPATTDRDALIEQLQAELLVAQTENANLRAGLEALGKQVAEICDALDVAIEADRQERCGLERMATEGSA